MINIDELHWLVGDYIKDNLSVENTVWVENTYDSYGEHPCKKVTVTTRIYLGQTLVSESTSSDYN